MPTETIYHTFFRLRENPFNLTPDPRFVFMSRHHKEALAHLLYGTGDLGGFVLLTGDIGTGKTTLCRTLLEQVPENVNIALVLNPKLTALELVASICDELNITYPKTNTSLKSLIDRLNHYLLASHNSGGRTVLVIDEAQNLSSDVLEQVRLLTNLETTTRKLLQIILIGQPELQTLMDRPELRQLNQRITARYHLPPLGGAESAAYIDHRLTVAGAQTSIFSQSALRSVYRWSRGIPRLINIICERAMLGAYAARRSTINRALVCKAAREVLSHKQIFWSFRASGWLWGGLIATALLAAVYFGSDLGAGRSMDRMTSKPAVRDPVTSPPPATRVSVIPDQTIGDIDRAKVVASDPKNPLSLTKNLQAHLSAADLDSRLQSGVLQTDTQTAFATLFGYWQMEDNDPLAGSACQRALTRGLQCVHARGNWTTLSLYNRPAVLELTDSSRRLHHVVAVSLNDNDVLLKAGSTEITLSRSTVEALWYGDFIVFWQPLPSGKTLLRLGDQGSDVLWLRRLLSETIDEPFNQVSSQFDAELKSVVERFQKTHGLRADGMVGEKTIRRLNRYKPEPAVPVLVVSQ